LRKNITEHVELSYGQNAILQGGKRKKKWLSLFQLLQDMEGVRLAPEEGGRETDRYLLPLINNRGEKGKGGGVCKSSLWQKS